MRRSLILAASALLVLSSAACMGGQDAPDPAGYAMALADPVRPAEDRARDEGRHTAATLSARPRTAPVTRRAMRPRPCLSPASGRARTSPT